MGLVLQTFTNEILFILYHTGALLQSIYFSQFVITLSKHCLLAANRHGTNTGKFNKQMWTLPWAICCSHLDHFLLSVTIIDNLDLTGE